MDVNNSNKEEMPDIYIVSLRDGSSVDIGTKEGANAFLLLEEGEGEKEEGDSSSVDDFFSSHLQEIQKLRRRKNKKRRLEAKLEKHYGFLEALVRYADPETFRAKIPESEVRASLEYVIQEIKFFTEKRNWISTGRLYQNDCRVLLFCDNLLNQNVLPVYLAFESEFFFVLANFIKARKGNNNNGGKKRTRALMPSVAICGEICRIAYSAMGTASFRFDKCWSLEKIFKKFEESGLLEQILRCATALESVTPGSKKNYLESLDPADAILANLTKCTGLLRRKFKLGKPCGDTLKAILDGRDGSKSIHPKILNRLQGIARLAETSADPTTIEAKYCQNCFKEESNEAPLSFCARCRAVHYCSKGCQKDHWKTHRGWCREIRRPERDMVHTLASSIDLFRDQNLGAVLRAIVEKLGSTTNAKAGDWALEVDFMPNEEGIIPAFHDPPKFRIVLIRDYISGQEMPDWLPEEVGRENFKEMVKREMAGFGPASNVWVMHHGGRAHICDFSFESLCKSAFKMEMSKESNVF